MKTDMNEYINTNLCKHFCHSWDSVQVLISSLARQFNAFLYNCAFFFSFNRTSNFVKTIKSKILIMRLQVFKDNSRLILDSLNS